MIRREAANQICIRSVLPDFDLGADRIARAQSIFPEEHGYQADGPEIM